MFWIQKCFLLPGHFLIHRKAPLHSGGTEGGLSLIVVTESGRDFIVLQYLSVTDLLLWTNLCWLFLFAVCLCCHSFAHRWFTMLQRCPSHLCRGPQSLSFTVSEYIQLNVSNFFLHLVMKRLWLSFPSIRLLLSSASSWLTNTRESFCTIICWWIPGTSDKFCCASLQSRVQSLAPGMSFGVKECLMVCPGVFDFFVYWIKSEWECLHLTVSSWFLEDCPDCFTSHMDKFWWEFSFCFI